MRMRKKRHFEPRMEACGELLLVRGRPCLNLKEAAQNYRALLDPEEVFGRRAPLELEIGCGNGGFLLEKARRHPEIDFFAVEISSNVALTAMERTRAAGFHNIRFLNIPAEILPCYVKERSISKIYLNFSTPLPAKNREKQRLTAPRFLHIYYDLLEEEGTIEQKTDSEPFFDYSLEQYAANGFEVVSLTRDLHHSEFAAENIITEYEGNFIAKGLPIFRAEVKKRG